MKLPPGGMYGMAVSAASLAGLTLSETTYLPGLELPDHAHERPYFCLVLDGHFTERYGAAASPSRDCGPMTLLYHPAGETHADRFRSGSRCFNVELSRAWVERARRHRLPVDEPACFEGGPLAALAIRLRGELRRADGLSALAAEGLALELLAGVGRGVSAPQRHVPAWLDRARRVLRERFLEPPDLGELANIVGVHPAHLSREFRRRHGCTVGEYVRGLRIQFACGRIAASDQPISEIALEAGFFDQSHFSRAFRRATGLTPGQYRQAAGRR